MTINSIEEELDNFSELTKTIRRILHINPENKIQTLWDDISLHYSSKCYPIVHEVENLMRKLITKFMLTTVGLGWTKETIPEDLKKKSRSECVENNNNYLYETDFIQLSNFLFDKYRTASIEELTKKISEINQDTISVSEIVDYIPKSNWERYFQKNVDFEGEQLKSQWDKLYKLRCKIAHNNSFNKSDFEQAFKIASEVKIRLNNAINILDKIHITEEDREDLVESVAISSSSVISSFIHKWKLLESITIELLIKKDLLHSKMNKKERHQFYRHRLMLLENNLINSNSYRKIQELNKIRNIIVHESEQYFTEIDIKAFSKELDHIIEEINEQLLNDQPPQLIPLVMTKTY